MRCGLISNLDDVVGFFFPSLC